MIRAWIAPSIVWAFASLAWGAAATDVEAADGGLTFEQHVRPILKAHCLDCHGGGEGVQGGLDLRLRRLMVAGGESGAAIKPGKPDESLLVHRIRAGEMPPGKVKVKPAELAVLEQWIAAGASTARPEPDQIDKGVGITPEEREFWAFQPLKAPSPQASPAGLARARSPVDLILLARLEERGRSFSAEADRVTLARRLAFDLTGVPLDPETTAEFERDEGPDALERLVDRLLASPRYGERWGRHWLDVAGYADSDGFTTADAVRPYAYKYRDYVIRSFNADKPYDRFLTEQLAGDELTGGATTNFTLEQTELLTATGFLRMAADGTGSGAPDQDLARNQVMTDTLKILGVGVLGLSVHCAQCHDHRYDPIPQTDYYRLRAVFEPALDWKNWRTPEQRLVSLYTDADRAKAAEVEAEAAKIGAERQQKQEQFITAALEKELLTFPEGEREALRTAYRTAADKRTPEQNALLKANPKVNISPGVLYQYDAAAAEELKKYDQRIAEVRAKKPVQDFLHALVEPPGATPPTHLFHRGDHRQPTEVVGPGDLTIAAPPGSPPLLPADDDRLPTTGRRLALARRLTAGDHPLVGRVLANRLWMHHFGRGIVPTAGEFGVLGERPSHPELLDWLALELPRREWSLKSMHRLLLTSSVWRQSSRREAPAAESGGVAARGSTSDKLVDRDDDNRWLGRMAVRRLEAESLRDRLLAAGGRLSSVMYGPAVAIKEDDVGQVVVAGDETRRSIYLQVRRSQPVALLTAFDAPVMETNCDRRNSSTVASQSLMLMNSDFMQRQAAEVALRVRQTTLADGPLDPAPTGELAELAARVERARPGSVWSYGTGTFDAVQQRTAGFAPLSHWTGSSWQGGTQLPDPQRGWALLHATGGHPGDDAARSVVRRWTAPAAARLALRGSLEHGSPNGDGVRGRIVSSRSGLLGEWTAFHGKTETPVAAVQVEPGETLDWIVDCREHVTSDSFVWSVELETLDPPAGSGGRAWKSAAEFQGPAGPALAPQLAAAWRLTLDRAASEDELRAAFEFARRQLEYLSSPEGASAATAAYAAAKARGGAPGSDPESIVLMNLCQTLMSGNEFLYVD